MFESGEWGHTLAKHYLLLRFGSAKHFDCDGDPQAFWPSLYSHAKEQKAARFRMTSIDLLASPGVSLEDIYLADRKWVDALPTADTLKVILFGHGDGHSLHLWKTDSEEGPFVSGEVLIALLTFLLALRAGFREDSERTELNIVSCWYGRPNELDLKQSNAWKLFVALRARNVYVTLFARTEPVSYCGEHVLTHSTIQTRLSMPIGKSWAKAAFTKLRCFYTPQSFGECELLPKVQASERDAKRAIWAQHATDTVIDIFLRCKDAEGKSLLRGALLMCDAIAASTVDVVALETLLELLLGRFHLREVTLMQHMEFAEWVAPWRREEVLGSHVKAAVEKLLQMLPKG